MPTRLIALAAALLLTAFANSAAHARTAYVSDYLEVTLRTGPSVDNKIIAMLGSDTQLEILQEQEGWAYVRTPENKEGWTLLRFISDKKPKRMLIADLEKKIQTISEACKEPAQIIDRLQGENEELKKSLTTANGELAKVHGDYSSLRNDSANVIEIRNQYQQAAQRLASATAITEKLTAENKALRASTEMRWFLSGAGVVCFSWLVGYLMGHTQRKRKRQSLYS